MNMGMRDESWCAGCGVGIHFTEDENAMCHNCNEEGYAELETRSSKFMQYMKLHLISLEQDSEAIQAEMDLFEELESNEYRALDIEDISLNGQIIATRHLLSVATDIMNSSNERI
jgi:hypothetical protein